jgi:hypothetical protein
VVGAPAQKGIITRTGCGGRPLTTQARLRFDEVEQRVCDIASMQLGFRRDRISPDNRLLEDLGCDRKHAG